MYQELKKEGAFDHDLRTAINQMFSELYSSVLLSGNVYYIDPVTGIDINNGTSPAKAVQSLDRGYQLLTDGNNDILVVLGDGTTTATVRLSANFTWAKNAAHLIGVASGVNISNRARIAPTSGVTAFANFFTVSGNGCRFQNLQWFHGFTIGVAAAICMTVTGGRNMFSNCHIAGMGDTESGHDAGSRNVKISGTGENQFVDCTIGIDTIARDVANASVEFAGGCPRNVFRRCLFPLYATANTVLYGIVSAAAGSDRFQLFDQCTFLNAIKSGTGTAITGAFTLAASIGGLIALTYPMSVGVTAWGTDATSKAQMYVVGPANSTSTGVGANPA